MGGSWRLAGQQRGRRLHGRGWLGMGSPWRRCRSLYQRVDQGGMGVWWGVYWLSCSVSLGTSPPSRPRVAADCPALFFLFFLCELPRVGTPWPIPTSNHSGRIHVACPTLAMEEEEASTPADRGGQRRPGIRGDSPHGWAALGRRVPPHGPPTRPHQRPGGHATQRTRAVSARSSSPGGGVGAAGRPSRCSFPSAVAALLSAASQRRFSTALPSGRRWGEKELAPSNGAAQGGIVFTRDI